MRTVILLAAALIAINLGWNTPLWFSIVYGVFFLISCGVDVFYFMVTLLSSEQHLTKQIYQYGKDIAVAHTNPVDYKQINGFGVGYPFELNAENMEKAKFRSDLFYAEKWYLKGKAESEMLVDYPFVLMLPVKRYGEIPKAKQPTTSDYTLVFWVLDLLYYDRHNNNESKAAKRSREEVFNDTSIIAQQYLIELSSQLKSSGAFIIKEKTYTEEKVYNFLNDRLAGSSIELQIRVPNDCPSGIFDYNKIYSQSQGCNQ